jgi:hypothetical protein
VTSTTDTSAVIEWTTDEASNSVVQYGTSSSTWGSYPYSENGAGLVTSHNVTLTGLNDTTTYYFRVGSTDASGNGPTTSNEVSFSTDNGVDDPDGDIDGDGMPNAWEDTYGLDLNDSSDAYQDADWDGLTNLQEYQNNTNPNNSDTDGDEMTDKWEVDNGLDPRLDDASEDPDGDGYSNLEEYNARTLPNVYTDNLRPYTPALSSPTNGQTGVSLTPELEIGDFSDPDADDTHTRSQWQISSESDFSSLVLDITSTSHLTSLIVPQSILDEGTSYYWRVRFYDNLAASDWSEPYVFTTLTTSNDTDANGIPDAQEVDGTVDLDGDGTSDIDQSDIKCVKTVLGDVVIGVSIKDSTTVTSIESLEFIDPDTIPDTTNRPEGLPLGIISFRLNVGSPGDTAEVTLYFSGMTEETEEDLENLLGLAKWYKYDSIDGWQDYSDYATFDIGRKIVTLQLKDGSYGDADETANGVIVDPSGIGTGQTIPESSLTPTPELTPTSADRGYGGGCFIATAALGSNAKLSSNHPSVRAVVRYGLIPITAAVAYTPLYVFILLLLHNLKSINFLTKK